jgi:hypothetical protein
MVKRNPLADGNKAFPSVKSIIQVDSVTIREYSIETELIQKDSD